MKTATHTTLALLGLLASAIGMAGSAEAQSARLINQCDRLCANNPRAICYATCLGGNGLAPAPQAKPKRPQPVSVQSSANPGWLDAVYASPSRAGPSGNGGGSAGAGGGKGK